MRRTRSVAGMPVNGRILAALVTAAVLAALAVPTAGQTESEEADPKSGAAKDDVVVITNDVLEERYARGRVSGVVSGRAASAEDEKDADPGEGAAARSEEDAGEEALRRIRSEAGRKRANERRIVETEKEIDRLEARVAELESRARSIRNPLLPPPKLTDEEKVSWAGLSGPARLERNEALLETARAELEAARVGLRELRSPKR